MSKLGRDCSAVQWELLEVVISCFGFLGKRVNIESCNPGVVYKKLYEIITCLNPTNCQVKICYFKNKIYPKNCGVTVFLSGFGPRGGKTAICNLVGGHGSLNMHSTCQFQGGARVSLGGANAPPRPPLKETLGQFDSH